MAQKTHVVYEQPISAKFNVRKSNKKIAWLAVQYPCALECIIPSNLAGFSAQRIDYFPQQGFDRFVSRRDGCNECVSRR